MVTIFLMVTGLYIVIARGNMVKKLVGLSIFQTSVYLLFLEPGKILGGTAPILDPAFTVYSNPLPHVLILTAIVVGVATLALGLALVVRINEAYGTIEEDEIFDEDRDAMNAALPHLPALQVVMPLFGALLAALPAPRRRRLRAGARRQPGRCRVVAALLLCRCCARADLLSRSAAGSRPGASSTGSICSTPSCSCSSRRSAP